MRAVTDGLCPRGFRGHNRARLERVSRALGSVSRALSSTNAPLTGRYSNPVERDKLAHLRQIVNELLA